MFWSSGIRDRGLQGGGMRLSHDRIPRAPHPELGRRAHPWRRRRAGRVLAWDHPDAVGPGPARDRAPTQAARQGKQNLKHGK
ncbi:hypothetical protein ND748_26215 [Frankia sp. AiPs1]|nr:hypothetical protein [Frankia sp. AiPs1]